MNPEESKSGNNSLVNALIALGLEPEEALKESDKERIRREQRKQNRAIVILALLIIGFGLSWILIELRVYNSEQEPAIVKNPEPTVTITSTPLASATETLMPTPSRTVAPVEVSGELKIKNVPFSSQIRLGQPEGDVWEDIVEPITVNRDGTFAVTLPQGFGRSDVWLGVPEEWHSFLEELNGLQGEIQTGRNYAWKQLSEAEEPLFLAQDAVVKTNRMFSGTVYFQGENAPERATVYLEICPPDENISMCSRIESNNASALVERPSDYLSKTISVPFTLTHISPKVDIIYRVVITTQATLSNSHRWIGDTLVSSRPYVTESNAILVPVRKLQPLIATGLQFVGPFPLILSYEFAEFNPPYDPEAPGPWKHLDRESGENPHPYITREDDASPGEMWARWPLWLPTGHTYLLTAKLPGNNQSAEVVYKLMSSELQNTIWRSNPIPQCDRDGEIDIQIGEFNLRPDSAGKLWLTVEDVDASANADCGGMRYRLAIWKLQVDVVDPSR